MEENSLNKLNNSSDEVKIAQERNILEAIDQLRKRKARPDADRICNYLLRRYSVDARDTIADLHLMIEHEKVIQVDYKGNTSYRNPLKWTRLQLYKNRPEGFLKEKLNHELVSNALSDLVLEEPDYLDHGVPQARLIEQLVDGNINPTSRRIVEEFLKKEVACGNLNRLENGNYFLNELNSTTMSNNSDSRSPSQNDNSKNKFERNGISSYGYKIVAYDEPEITYTGYQNIKKSKTENSKDENHFKKDQCYEIIVGKKNDQENNKERNINGIGNDQNGKLSSQESKDNQTQSPNPKRSTKSERKQKLCVRSDDASDLIFKFEDYRSIEKDKRDDADRLSDERDADEDAGRSSTNPSPTPSNNNLGTFRSARRKRAVKKVFDPSDNNVVKRKRGRQPNHMKALSNIQNEIQEIVTKTSTKESPKDPNKSCSVCSKDKQDSLISCRDCTVRAHPTCVYTAEELLNKTGTSWQCERCKTCTVCYETTDAGPLVTCFSCDDAYHYTCHTPRIVGNRIKWNCCNCNPKYAKNHTQNSNSSWSNNLSEINSSAPILPPVLSPQVSPTRNATELIEEDISRDEIDPNIPDASDWTSEQVYQYFARLFPKEAEVFRTQEIDGHSLLLLKRSDVLSGLDLLLGPALKIYRHVLKLQVRRDDPRLYWQ